MIYLDTSVALAALFAEDRRPTASFWESRLVASRLLEHELRVRANARGMAQAVPEVLARVALVELAPAVLERALQPFPTPVRTLDALHLSTVLYLRAHGQDVALAAYDRRMIEAAEGLGLRIWPSSRSA